MKLQHVNQMKHLRLEAQKTPSSFTQFPILPLHLSKYSHLQFRWQLSLQLVLQHALPVGSPFDVASSPSSHGASKETSAPTLEAGSPCSQPSHPAANANGLCQNSCNLPCKMFEPMMHQRKRIPNISKQQNFRDVQCSPCFWPSHTYVDVPSQAAALEAALLCNPTGPLVHRQTFQLRGLVQVGVDRFLFRS